jgi:AmpD protein
MLIRNGEIDIARQIICSNCDDRPDNEISLIVVHCISLPAGNYDTDFVEALFCNHLQCSAHPDFADLEGLKVSSHLFIRRDGTVLQFVPFHRRAWHAGKSNYAGRESCNDFSVGIELEGVEDGEYADEQYCVLANICQVMLASWSLDSSRIVGHSDIAPGRKKDPGPGFDWDRLKDKLASLAGMEK